MTKVLFRYDKVCHDILAVFPDMYWVSYGSKRVTCYAHIGQHHECHLDYVREETRPAKPNEYADLLAELVRIGYNDLKILKRMPR